MNLDFATIMVILVAVTGFVCLLDRWVLAPRRRKAGVGDTNAPPVDQQPVLVQYARSFFPIFLIVLLLRSFLVEPFRIPSGSMMPTLLIGDLILVNKYTYGIRLPVVNTKVIDIGSPKRGDVVVFRYPRDPSTPFIKRVVGLPGDRIAYYDKTLRINGKPVPRKALGPYEGLGPGSFMTGASLLDESLDDVEHHILVAPHRGSPGVETTIPEGQYFVMGDNRDNSQDSRFWGTVPDANLIGKAFMIWMNWDSANDGIGVDWGRIGSFIP